MTVEETVRYKGVSWVHITNPKEDTLEVLGDKYGFHHLDLEDCLSRTESPKIEQQKNYVFVVFHFPLKDIKNNYISIEPLNVFVGNNYIITLGGGRLKKLEDFFQSVKEDLSEKKAVFSKGPGFLLYHLVNELFEVYTPYISQLNRAIREIEDDIFEGKIQKDRLYDIMTVKRQITNLKRALEPHTDIIQSLERIHKRFMSKSLELYFDDVADKIERGTSNLVAMNEMINTVYDANESLTSHNTNRVMKVLTIFSVTLMPLTLMSGIYGMNVQLPYSGNSEAFWLISILMGAILIFTLILFKVKRYI